ncbi:MAG TPA: S41 family peptidase [Blastocatellia bacterium]|nr:S41 family peptidase [Blastocatellia bacterium]
MRSKRRYWLLVVALVMPLTFAGAHSGQRAQSQSDENSPARRRIAEDFTKAILVAQENYAGKVEWDRLTKASILGMLHTLDPHSGYFDRKEWEDFQNDQRSRYFGIGSVIAQRNGKVYITSPFNGTPAHRSGIRFGDQIIEVDGQSTEGWSSSQVSSKLLGSVGTPVTVKLSRLGVAQPLEFKLIRAEVSLPSIPNYFLLGNGVGYISMSRGFNTTTDRELRDALRDLKEHGMTSLLLDLRGNRGGLVEQAFRVSNNFLYRGQKVLSMRGRPDVFPNRDFTANNPSPEDYPMVVLINRSSASAAEIVAGALQDHDRARLVGENSFGKGLVQTVFTLSDGSGLTLTTGHYYTPSGRLIQRDYSGKSFYDYYLQRGDKDAVNRNDEKHTDAGRTVYGGGGIQPDVAVKLPARELELGRFWIEPVFQFARVLVAGQVPGLGDFKVDHNADHNHRLGDEEYVVTPKVLAAFKVFLREHKDLKVDEARVDKDADFLKTQIRSEVVTAAYGQEASLQVLLERDIQMQHAIAELPKAKAMAEDIRRERAAAARGGEIRRN